MLVFSDGVDTASWLDADRVLAAIRRAAVVPLRRRGRQGSDAHGRAAAFRSAAQHVLAIEEPFDAAERFLRDLVVDRRRRASSTPRTHARSNAALPRRSTAFASATCITYVPQRRRGIGLASGRRFKVKGHRYRVRATPGLPRPCRENLPKP